MANQEHVKLVLLGERAIARWRKQHPEERLDLSGADLSWADLREAKLDGVNRYLVDI
ncbi:MAG: pentapeptide repeat-containing protein [Chloroflexi bacterium]|nr:pentapeptide repeat-containing protein [Chloroflexota bacterium]